MIKKVTSSVNNVEVGCISDSSFLSLLQQYKDQKIHLLVDENTRVKCLPYLLQQIPVLNKAEIIKIPAGEKNKSLATCTQIWEKLTTSSTRRGGLLLNLGGGVVTDMGGFAASLFKRGIDFINIPTTLLSMIDASVGGKTGVNFKTFKNQIGVFSQPRLTICDPNFLKTLEQDQILSGWGEIIKHGLIAAHDYFENTKEAISTVPNEDLIASSIVIKAKIVDNDYKEKGERKKLNFGHSIGHAVESLLLEKQQPRTHGECVAWGMVAEAQLSTKIGLSKKEFIEIKELIASHFPPIQFNNIEIERLLELMNNDKKNQSNSINFTLLKCIGEALIDNEMEEKEIRPILESCFL